MLAFPQTQSLTALCRNEVEHKPNNTDVQHMLKPFPQQRKVQFPLHKCQVSSDTETPPNQTVRYQYPYFLPKTKKKNVIISNDRDCDSYLYSQNLVLSFSLYSYSTSTQFLVCGYERGCILPPLFPPFLCNVCERVTMYEISLGVLFGFSACLPFLPPTVHRTAVSLL